MKYCELTPGKLCNHCGECERCDLDPEKICDNCMQCVSGDADFRGIIVDEIITDPEEAQWHIDN